MYGRVIHFRFDLPNSANESYKMFMRTRNNRKRINFSSLERLESQAIELLKEREEAKNILNNVKTLLNAGTQKALDTIKSNQRSQNKVDIKALLANPRFNQTAKSLIGAIAGPKDPQEELIIATEAEIIKIKTSGDQTQLNSMEAILAELKTAREQALFDKFVDKNDKDAINLLSGLVKQISADLDVIDKDLHQITISISALKSRQMNKSNEDTIVGRKRSSSELFSTPNDSANDSEIGETEVKAFKASKA